MVLLMLTLMERTHFSRWAVTDPSFAPQAATSLLIPGFGYCQIYTSSSNICVVEEDSRIISVNEDRELYELDLNSMTFNEGTFSPSRSGKSSHEPYCQARYQLSSNGDHLVAYYITYHQTFDFTNARLGDEQSGSRNPNKTRIELRFVKVSDTAEQMQKIELEYLESELPKHYWHDIKFSPDLSMVRAGRQIFDLREPNHPLMSVPSSLLIHLEYGRPSEVFFSSCNDYLIGYIADVEPVNLGLFRICRTTRKIEELAINGLEDLVGCISQAEFHPMLPLILLTSSACRENDTRKDLRSIKVVQFDLREPKPVPIVLFEE